MSDRLKYAKLRLISPDDRAAAPLDVKVDRKGSDNVDTGENIKSSCKKSKFFTTESSSQKTFIEIDDEQSDDHNKESNDHNSRRRSVSDHEVCSGDGPKMPKLRKKISKESGVISHFLHPHNPENDDFEEKRHRAVSQPKQTKAKRAVKKTNKPKNQSDIRNLFKKYKSDYDVLHKLIENHSVSEQIDPEQLQMALAMSRSLVDQKCSSSASSSTEILTSSGSCSITAEERRIVGIRTTLEQFGFRCKNSFTDYDLNVIFGAGCKNVKKIKHTRATNLQRRTRKELADFIDRQTSTIFPVETITLDSRSSVLYPSVNLQSYISNLFWMAQTEQTSNNLFFKYYVPELLEVNPAPVGCLLKDWSKIPGREKTPERNSCAKINDLNSSFAQDCTLNRCARPTSPDLFDEFEDEVSNFCLNGSGTINQFERIQKEKVSENEDLEENGQLQSPVKQSRHALFAPSEEPNSEETLAENSSVPNTQIGESTAAIRKELQKKQESNRILFKGSDLVEKLNESEVENCTKARMKEVFNRSTVGNEDDKSSELDSPSAEVPALDSSAENMFDETDIVPIVSFEVNSSEQEKTYREQCFNPDMSEQPFNGCISKVIAEPPKDTTTKVNAGLCGLQPLEDEKELSFNRIAVKARITEALQNSAHTVETVDLVDCAATASETEEDVDVKEGKSNDSCPEISWQRVINETKDDVLYISDDEVNYSVRELSRLPVDAEDDLNRTEIYDCLEPRTDGKEEENEASVLFYNHQSMDSGRLLVTSAESTSSYKNESESGADKSPVNCAESTFAYLESLTKQYDLPPLQLRQTGKIDFVCQTNSSILEYSKPDSPPPRTQRSVDQFATEKFNFASSTSDGGPNMLEKYKISYLKENNSEAEIIASKEQTDIKRTKLHQHSSSKLCSTAKSCCEPISPKKVSNCTNTMASDPGALSCSEDAKAKRFENMFHELKIISLPIACPEYLISVQHVDFGPPCFENMTASEMERELFKYGLKDLKRSKAIKVLNHLFEKTHMYVDVQESVKHNIVNVKGCTKITTKGSNTHPSFSPFATTPLLSEHYRQHRIRAFKLDPNSDDLYLPLKPRKKIAWSAVPLHITFFNLVAESVELQRQILLYQPVNLDEIYSLLKDAGLRYETKDLIAFLDKRCITFRCTSSSGDRTKPYE